MSLHLLVGVIKDCQILWHALPHFFQKADQESWPLLKLNWLSSIVRVQSDFLFLFYRCPEHLLLPLPRPPPPPTPPPPTPSPPKKTKQKEQNVPCGNIQLSFSLLSIPSEKKAQQVPHRTFLHCLSRTWYLLLPSPSLSGRPILQQNHSARPALLYGFPLIITPLVYLSPSYASVPRNLHSKVSRRCSLSRITWEARPSLLRTLGTPHAFFPFFLILQARVQHVIPSPRSLLPVLPIYR